MIGYFTVLFQFAKTLQFSSVIILSSMLQLYALLFSVLLLNKQGQAPMYEVPGTINIG